MPTSIEQTRVILDHIRNDIPITDDLLEDFAHYCEDLLQSKLTNSAEVQDLQKLASLLYNECRIRLKKETDVETIVRIRFCSCELLQASCINSAPTGDSSKSLLVNAPDIIRAYQHTARSMRDYDLGDLPQQCYLNAIKIVDTLQPILEDIETNERTINR